MPATILGLGLLGLLFATTFVLYRHANALSNMLEWPVLARHRDARAAVAAPGLVASDRWVLAPTWGVQAIRSRDGTTCRRRPIAVWTARHVAMTLALGALYLALGLALGYFERRPASRRPSP